MTPDEAQQRAERLVRKWWPVLKGKTTLSLLIAAELLAVQRETLDLPPAKGRDANPGGWALDPAYLTKVQKKAEDMHGEYIVDEHIESVLLVYQAIRGETP